MTVAVGLAMGAGDGRSDADGSIRDDLDESIECAALWRIDLDCEPLDALSQQARIYREAWAYVEAIALADQHYQRDHVAKPAMDRHTGVSWQRFLDGYRAGGGREDWIDAWHLTIYGWTEHCPNGESGGNPYAVSPLGHKGLLQWADPTWAAVAAQTGYWDVWSSFDNGVNAAWMTLHDAPAQHWSCWP